MFLQTNYTKFSQWLFLVNNKTYRFGFLLLIEPGINIIVDCSSTDNNTRLNDEPMFPFLLQSQHFKFIRSFVVCQNQIPLTTTRLFERITKQNRILLVELTKSQKFSKKE